MIKKEKEKSIEQVEQMVKDNVITKEKGEKLKQAITNSKRIIIVRILRKGTLDNNSEFLSIY